MKEHFRRLQNLVPFYKMHVQPEFLWYDSFIVNLVCHLWIQPSIVWQFDFRIIHNLFIFQLTWKATKSDKKSERPISFCKILTLMFGIIVDLWIWLTGSQRVKPHFSENFIFGLLLIQRWSKKMACIDLHLQYNITFGKSG